METMYKIRNLRNPNHPGIEIDNRFDLIEKLKDIKRMSGEAGIENIRVLRKLEDENEEYEILRIRDMDINI